MQYILAMNNCIFPLCRRPVLSLDPWATIAKWSQADSVAHDGEGIDPGLVGIAAVVGEG